MVFPEDILAFKKVRKTFKKSVGSKKQIVLPALSFSCHSGQTMALIGANGAGKSTCIKLLMDFIRPDGGKIDILGFTPQNPKVRAEIGYLPEIAYFPPNLTLLDMLFFTGTSCNLSKDVIKGRSEDLLRRLNLWHVRKHLLRTYSKGMRQRANFAVALINDPSFLVLDEPMSGLDPIGRNDIMALILELKNRGKSILFCSHILDDVDRLADKVLVLHLGRKLFSGTIDQLCAQQNNNELTECYLGLVEEVTCEQ